MLLRALLRFDVPGKQRDQPACFAVSGNNPRAVGRFLEILSTEVSPEVAHLFFLTMTGNAGLFEKWINILFESWLCQQPRRTGS